LPFNVSSLSYIFVFISFFLILCQVHALGDTSSSSTSPTHPDSKLPEGGDDTPVASSSGGSSNIVAAPRDESDDLASQKKKAKDAKKKSLKRL
jgi:hypothetical protein